MKNPSSKETKNNKNKKYKIIKIVVIILVSLILLSLVVTYTLFVITHKDKNRNSVTDENITSTQIIEKNLIESFKDTRTTGKISFRLSDDDINLMLSNIAKKDLWKNAQSVYYSSEQGHHFYIDLKRKLGIDTRIDVVLDELLKAENENTKTLEIKKETIGKLDYIFHRLDLNDFKLKLASKALLPVTYEENQFLLSPLSFLSYMPNENIESYINELISLKPECVSLDSNSLFGFDIDLTLFEDSSSLKEVDDEIVDLSEKLRLSLTPDFFSSLEIDQPKTACSIGLGEINKIIDSNLTENFEHLENESIAVKVDIGIDEVFVYLKDKNHLSIALGLSFNGYRVHINRLSTIEKGLAEMKMTFTLSKAVSLNDLSLQIGKSVIRENAVNYLSTLFKTLNSKYEYFTFNQNTDVLALNLNYVGNDISHFDLYDVSFLVDDVNLNCFNIVIYK